MRARAAAAARLPEVEVDERRAVLQRADVAQEPHLAKVQAVDLAGGPRLSAPVRQRRPAPAVRREERAPRQAEVEPPQRRQVRQRR